MNTPDDRPVLIERSPAANRPGQRRRAEVRPRRLLRPARQEREGRPEVKNLRDTWTRVRGEVGQWRCHVCRAYNWGAGACHACGYKPTWMKSA